MSGKHAAAVLLAMICCLLLPGCWNYREVDEISIIMGIALDKQEDDYMLTVEVVKNNDGNNSGQKPELLTSTGKSIFDAARNMIAISGKKLYWSHAKVIILSEAIAREGIIPVLDWLNRDSETRPDYKLFISREKSAREILQGEKESEKMVSTVIEESIKNEKNLSKAPEVALWEFVNALQHEGKEPVSPAIRMVKQGNRSIPKVEGTAVFRGDRMVGFLNGRETQAILFAMDKIKGGLLVYQSEDDKIRCTLEIFRNRTKVELSDQDHQLSIRIKVKSETALDEVQRLPQEPSSALLRELEQGAARQLEGQIRNAFKKLQTKLGSDIIGAGEKLRERSPDVWKQEGTRWKEQFRQANLDVQVEIKIRNTALMSKMIRNEE